MVRFRRIWKLSQPNCDLHPTILLNRSNIDANIRKMHMNIVSSNVGQMCLNVLLFMCNSYKLVQLLMSNYQWLLFQRTYLLFSQRYVYLSWCSSGSYPWMCHSSLWTILVTLPKVFVRKIRLRSIWCGTFWHIRKIATV